MAQRIAPNTNCSPVHANPCLDCTYLGTAIFYGKTFDFWTDKAAGTGMNMIVCRWSSDPLDEFKAPVKLARMMPEDKLFTYAVNLWEQWDQYMDDMCYSKWEDGEYPGSF